MSLMAKSKKEICALVRCMIRRDLAEVLQIEQESFEFAWSEDDFLRALRQLNCMGMVAEYDGYVAGFMVLEFHKLQIRVLNLAVTPPCRRYGVGSQMIAHLISRLSPPRRNIAMKIRETNLAAQLFLRKNGFRAKKILREQYYDKSPGEDAYLMTYSAR